MTIQKAGKNDTNITSSSFCFASSCGTNSGKMLKGGVILLNKPRGLSSNTAVNIVKKVLGAKKAGHLGTLDVEAEGLLPVTLNSATKLFDMFLRKDKEYLTTIKFGEERDTFDVEGKITRIDDKEISSEMIVDVLPALTGRQMQMPPAYSAKKIGGQKAYDLAREGKQPKLMPKEVFIYDFCLEKQVAKNLYLFRIACSSGTYVRSLCRDLAAKLSTCAVCYDITRTRCGVFDLRYANSLDEIKIGKYNLISPDSLFGFEKVCFSKTDVNKLLNGQFLKTELQDGEYRLYVSDNVETDHCLNADCSNSDFVGISNVREGLIKLNLRLN